MITIICLTFGFTFEVLEKTYILTAGGGCRTISTNVCRFCDNRVESFVVNSYSIKNSNRNTYDLGILEYMFLLIDFGYRVIIDNSSRQLKPLFLFVHTSKLNKKWKCGRYVYFCNSWHVVLYSEHQCYVEYCHWGGNTPLLDVFWKRGFRICRSPCHIVQ